MKKANLKCHRCQSTKLYKFDFDKQTNKKYKYKECHRQFVSDGGNNLLNPRYPKFCKATYLHHKYKHYNHFKCSNENITIL